MANISRRDMLKMSVVGAGALALSSVNANAAENEKAVKFDEEWDVVIIGSGFAGLSAGITAAKRGNKVLILEKMGRIGGNSVINGGIFAVPNNDLQKKEGIEDSNERFIADCMKAGLNINHVDLLTQIANRANDVYKLTLECGAQYRDRLEIAGGHSVPRTFSTANGSGSGIVHPMVDYFKKMDGVELRTRTKFDEFILSDSGRVVGLKVREGYKFDSKLLSDDDENTTGEVKYIKAKKGIVLAAGGFCRDVFFRQQQDPRLGPDTDSTNHPGATAGVLLKAFQIGATPVQVSWIQFGPWACPDEKGFGVGSMYNVNASFRYGISVNPKTGKRYMNELADRKTRADAMFRVIGTDKNYPINICDSEAVKNLLPNHLEKPLEAGILKKFDTLDDLAKNYNIPVKEFKETVAKYNEYVKNEKDVEFGKPLDKTVVNDITISKPPFYAERGVPKLHHTMGGLLIDTKARVISTMTKKPIEGLFAAGEITGGVHGASRLGSVAIADCLTFGMIAGENI
ncbi:flavocytochrome c [Campylobacter blaseri]|uniref:Flavocytochrome c n=1 Tax=Campylobacter blaseri TaxID=2042961 RepID=A0A2P8R191_9BACT|nr:flavocytochrome c [Campylobacter blaseri]PSM52267.1 flavocytochrome c [Campylobacter blaseri]PSM54033.1 flavocytochrome c [Campylobacter blaseri]QKF85474.1 flavocytochrome c [Campylobacter blaseri]